MLKMKAVLIDNDT